VPRHIRWRLVSLDKKIRKLSDFLARNTIIKIGNLKFKAIDYQSIFVVSPLHESWIWNYLKAEIGHVFLDIGAHIGKYSLCMAKIVGEKGLVIAIEPHPRNYKALLNNIFINNIRNVHAVNIAGWNKDCEIEMFIAPVSGNHSLKLNYGKEKIIVKAKPLDEIIKEKKIDRLDLVKIDVEGAELEVLQGLENSLRQYHPHVVVETFEVNTTKVKEFMEKNDYSITVIPQSGFSRGYYLYCK